MVDRWLPCDMAVLVQDIVYADDRSEGTKCKFILKLNYSFIFFSSEIGAQMNYYTIS